MISIWPKSNRRMTNWTLRERQEGEEETERKRERKIERKGEGDGGIDLVA
jgi:hypothetical protein